MTLQETKDKLVDVGITLVVFIFATIILGVVNYRNNQQEVDVFYRQIEPNIVVFDQSLANTVYLFSSAEDIRAAFPEFSARVNWDKEEVLFYISNPQPSSGYSLKLVDGSLQGQTILFRYRLVEPALGRSYLTAITQPVMAVAINRVKLVSSNPLILRFQDTKTNQTTSLTILPEEL